MAKVTEDDMNNANLSKEEREAIGDGDDTIDTTGADKHAADDGEDKGGDDEGKAGAAAAGQGQHGGGAGDAAGGKPAGSEGDGGAGEGADAGKAAAAGGQGGDGKGGKPGAADGDGAAAGGGADAGADAANAGKPGGQPAGVQAGADAPIFVPRVDAKAPENFKDRMTALDTQEAELEKKYSDGDITFKDWRAQQRAIDNERGTLQREQDRFETFQTINQSSEASAWQHQQNLFFGDKANAIYQKPAAYEALNVHVKTIAREEAFKDASGMSILREADRRFREDFGLPAPGAATAGDGKTVTGPDGKPLKVTGQQGEDRSGVPRTLAGVPAAGDAEVNDEFTKLDTLDGMAFEEAIADLERRDPAAARRYMETASATR